MARTDLLNHNLGRDRPCTWIEQFVLINFAMIWVSNLTPSIYGISNAMYWLVYLCIHYAMFKLAYMLHFCIKY